MTLTPTPGTAGALLQSQALAEAQPDSLTELWSRDPEHYSDQDLDRSIEALRAQRVRWKAAEAESQATAKSRGKPKPVTSLAVSADDLGL